MTAIFRRPDGGAAKIGVMTNILKRPRRALTLLAMALLTVLLHLAVFQFVRSGLRAVPGRSPDRPVQWIEARRLPSVVAVATRAQPPAPQMPRPRTRQTRETLETRPAPHSTPAVPTPAPSRPTAATEAVAGPLTPPAPIDLTPEGLGRALARDAGSRQPPSIQQWRRAPATPFGADPGAARLSETVGASGSRTTRVGTRWSTYCIRGPMPGRPPAPGAGPEPALPTNCP